MADVFETGYHLSMLSLFLGSGAAMIKATEERLLDRNEQLDGISRVDVAGQEGLRSKYQNLDHVAGPCL